MWFRHIYYEPKKNYVFGLGSVQYQVVFGCSCLCIMKIVADVDSVDATAAAADDGDDCFGVYVQRTEFFLFFFTFSLPLCDK